MKKQKRDIYQDVTNKIISSLENGVMPWYCPWDKTGENGFPENHKTGDHYKGINIVLFWIEQQEKGYSSSSWLTYKQAKELGGQVKKGEKGTTGIFYKMLERESERINDQGNKELDYIPMIKSFSVFNLDQIDGLEIPKTAEREEFKPISEAEKLIKATGIKIHKSGLKAFYRPSTDDITMPNRDRFLSAEDYYATLFHEISHATKHQSRCNRKPYETNIKKGAYAFEELIAEMGAAFTMASTKISGEIQNHASYIDSWLSVLKEDKRAIFKAASQAQKAHEWIIEKSS